MKLLNYLLPLLSLRLKHNALLISEGIFRQMSSEHDITRKYNSQFEIQARYERNLHLCREVKVNLLDYTIAEEDWGLKKDVHVLGSGALCLAWQPHQCLVCVWMGEWLNVVKRYINWDYGHGITAIRYQMFFLFIYLFFNIQPGHTIRGLVTINWQHCCHTKPPCIATERKVWADIGALSTRSIESKESSTQAPLKSILEIFHMLRLYRKSFLVNRKVCFQWRENDLLRPSGSLNGLPNRPELSCVNAGWWGRGGRGDLTSNPLLGSKAIVNKKRKLKSHNINKSSQGNLLLLHTPCD